MKTLRLFLLATCVLLLSTANAQTIRRVNNNSGVTGVNVYTTAQAAHDAAVANDILMIEPSSTSYGALTLTKPLKIYGNGYFLSTNTELKADQRSSILGNVYFNTGSGGGAIYGVETQTITIHGVSNITIQRCNSVGVVIFTFNVGNTVNTNVTNILVSGNYITGQFSEGATNPFTITSVLVNNNIMGYIYATDAIGVQNWVVKNNSITSQQISASSLILSNSVFENNILTAGGTPNFNNVTSNYNVSTEANSFTSGIGNQNSFNVAADRVSAGAGISTDETYQLKAGSTLKTAGSGGTEVGAYGGTTPYVVSGIPAIPSTTSLNNTATGSNTVPLQITISVKGNN